LKKILATYIQNLYYAHHSVCEVMPMKNNVRKIREDLLVSKAELARKAGISALTIDRIEKGMPCRMDTMRKIILALGLTLKDKEKVFPPV